MAERVSALIIRQSALGTPVIVHEVALAVLTLHHLLRDLLILPLVLPLILLRLASLVVVEVYIRRLGLEVALVT